jgi:hypothetical protein
MSEASQDVIRFLEQLRSERRELDLLISGIEKRLGITSEQVQGDAPNQNSGEPRIRRSIDEIPVGFFHNLSQAAATEKLLRLHPGQPLTTNEIIEVFRKSGMEVNPKNGATILYTTLTRNSKFERVAGKAWGLAEWYPGKKRKDAKDDDTGT